MKRKNLFKIGKVATSEDGNNDVNIGGQEYDYKGMPSGLNFNKGEKILVCFINDDTPIIIGDSGYTTPL